MKSLWIIITVIASLAVGFLIAAIVVLLKKPKQHIIIAVVCIIFVVFLVVYSIPYWKDTAKKETATYIGTYLKYQQGFGGTKPYIFTASGEQISFYVAAWDGAYNNYFEEGKTYKIIYFVNTKIISSAELIE